MASHPSRIRAWLPAVSYGALIFAVSSIPAASMPPGRFWDFDKLIHASEYLVLGALLVWALRRSGNQSATVIVVVAWVIATLYGISDELHQSFVPGRHMSWGDAVADSVGALLGCLSMQWACRRRTGS